jgi:hypothetical protein
LPSQDKYDQTAENEKDQYRIDFFLRMVFHTSIVSQKNGFTQKKKETRFYRVSIHISYIVSPYKISYQSSDITKSRSFFMPCTDNPFSL